MSIAYVSLNGRGATDACIAAAVGLLRARAVRLAGTVQTDRQRAGRDLCDMDLAVLPDGPVVRISQDRGALARGCRLDAGALEMAIGAVAAHMPQAEVLVVNKFGKLEAQGRGFVPLIVQAMERGMPVLIGGTEGGLPNLLAFCDGMALALPAEPAAIADWVLRAIAKQP